MSKPNPMPSYWALAEEVTHLHGLLDKYQAENVKLRKQYEAVIADYRSEVAELRKLVYGVYVCITVGDCTICPWFDECDSEAGCPWREIFADHMHKLGIEVRE